MESASNNPAITDIVPAIMGLRTPMRSIKRPALTENNMGSNPSRDMMMPTVNGDAWRWIANNGARTRQPENAVCSRMLGRMYA